MKKFLLIPILLSPLFTMAQGAEGEAKFLGFLFIGIIAFLIMVIITRAIFMITTITRNLKLQTELLTLIASKDADEATISQIRKIYETRDKSYYNKDLISKLK